MKHLVIVILFLSNTSMLLSQNIPMTMGARAMGMGNTASGLRDQWSAFNNPSGLAFVKQMSTGVSYEMHPSFSTFNRAGVVIAIPFRNTTVGLSAYRFGDDLYNEQIGSMSMANKFGIAALGLRVNYVQYNIAGYGTSSAITASFGGIAELTPKLLVGMSIDNLYSPRITTSEEILPTRVNVSLSFIPTKSLILSTELEKDLEKQLLIKAGLESAVSQKFFIRAGGNFYPSGAFAGFGFKLQKFHLDYAARIFTQSTFSHQATLSFNLKKK